MIDATLSGEFETDLQGSCCGLIQGTIWHLPAGPILTYKLTYKHFILAYAFFQYLKL
jgi:hypothetical protein